MTGLLVIVLSFYYQKSKHEMEPSYHCGSSFETHIKQMYCFLSLLKVVFFFYITHLYTWHRLNILTTD